MQGLGDFCVEPNDVLEDMASYYVERGRSVNVNYMFWSLVKFDKK